MKLIFSLSLVLISFSTSSQVKGLVVEEVDKKGEIIEMPVPGVVIYWQNESKKTISDNEGHYSIETPKKLPQNLIFNAFGYETDTFYVESTPLIGLKVKFNSKSQNLDVHTVRAKTSIISIDPAFKRLISSDKLKDAPCCNLSESFDRDATVDVNFTDAVSGTKKILMLGLDGIYTQMLAENIPTMRGLSAPYGLTFVPGPWIDGISITKGTGSVVNGYESITGQINFDFKKPDKAEKLYVGVFGNSNQRGELNLYSAKKLNEKWSTMLYAYANSIGNRVDRNNDGFLDDPLSTQLNFFNRWKYYHNDIMTQFGVRGLIDNRAGGQVDFDNPTDIGSNTKYGFGADSKQIEAFLKGGIPFEFRPKTSMAFMTSYRYHNQESFFGLKDYSGTMGSYYGNIIYASYIGNTDHTYKTGFSFIHDDYKERYVDNTISLDSSFNRIESVPGGFFEYTYSNAETFTVVAGIRGDLHSRFGFQYSPRVHMKWSPDEYTSIRVAGGKGFRSPNAIVENAGVFASSRMLKVTGNLTMEEALNYGVSVTREFELFGRDATLIADFFRTDFINQIVVDIENSDEIHFYNLNGKSYSNAAQLDLIFEPFDWFEVGMAYKYTDVKTTFGSELKSKPMVPVHRAMLALDYKTQSQKWKFSLTTNYFGTSRLPSTADNSIANQRPTISEDIFVMNFQVTRRFKKWEVYAGGENLLGQRQTNPIIGVDNPFGQEFDASLVWGPLMGQIAYAGLRLKIVN